MSKQPLIEQLNEAIERILSDPTAQLSSVDASLTDLLVMARDLWAQPRPDFKARLKTELERNITMSTKIATTRPGFRTLTPYLLPPNAGYLDFLTNVFGGVVTARHEAGPDRLHAEVRLGDSMLMVGVGSGRSMPVMLLAYVPDADAVYQRALAAGCKNLEPMTVNHGDRFGCVEDSVGNQWCIATHLGATYTKPNHNAITTCFHPEGAARFIDFLKQAFGATEIERHSGPGGKVMWAAIRIGDSTIGVGEPSNHSWLRPTPTMSYVYVPDADAAYAQAMRAGAKSIYAPADQPYGDRNGGVEDEWGNQWFMASPIEK